MSRIEPKSAPWLRRCRKPPANRERWPFDQGYTGEQPATDARAQGIRLEVVKLPTAKNGFVLLPRRWVVERSFAWVSRFRRLARDYGRLAETPAGLHCVAFALLLVRRFVTFRLQSA